MEGADYRAAHLTHTRSGPPTLKMAVRNISAQRSMPFVADIATIR